MAVSGDRRSNAVSLLPKGEKPAKAMERRVADLRRALLSNLPQEEIETATRILRTLEDRAHAYVQRGPMSLRRSEERRGGTGGVSAGRSRWEAYNSKITTNYTDGTR